MPEALWATFDTADRMARAVTELRERGQVAVESFSPFAVSAALDAIPGGPVIGPLRLPRRALPWVALVAGVLGGTAGYLIQWFANVWAYPQNAGGRPANAVPAFVFNAFESIVLVGSCAVVLALLVVLRLPRLWNPLETIDGFTRTSDDRFGVLVQDFAPGPAPDATARLLRQLGADEVRSVSLP